MGLLSLVPNLLPIIIGFGLWGFIVGEVGLAVSIVVAMTMGIVVDDTVHFISKYLKIRRIDGLNPKQAIISTFEIVGPALMSTSIVLASGFGLLLLSGFVLNSQMGLLTAMIVLIALLADFLLLPPLILLIDRK